MLVFPTYGQKQNDFRTGNDVGISNKQLKRTSERFSQSLPKNRFHRTRRPCHGARLSWRERGPRYRGGRIAFCCPDGVLYRLFKNSNHAQL